MRPAIAFSLVLALIGVVFAGAPSVYAAPSVARQSSSSCQQPPASGDLTTLSDAQRAAFGLPRKPQHMSASAWKNILNHARHRFCAAVPTNVSATSQESWANWAGNIAIGGGYQDVEAEFNTPCVSTSPRPAYSSHWVGLGGDTADGGGNLVQDGVEADVNSSGTASYYAWYQDYPHDKYENRITNFVVHCGDTIYAEANSNYSISGQAYMWIEDYSAGEYSAQESYLANGSTAEWISERPTVNGSLPTLADFHSLTFTSTFTVDNGSGLNVGQTNHNYAFMCNGGLWTCGPGSTTLAYPGSISSDGSSFSNYWEAGS